MNNFGSTPIHDATYFKGSGEDFLRFLPYSGRAAMLVM